MPAVTYTLSIDGVPASEDLLQAIQQIEVEDHAAMADMLRLRVVIGIKDGCAGWSFVDDRVFGRLANARLSVAVGSGRAETLINAFIIETNASFANQPGTSVLNVVAMDPTVLMNLEEKVKRWPNMADSDVANAVFSSPDYKFTPIVDVTKWKRQENEQTLMQRGTDIQFLQQLAQRNGFECYVETNGRTGQVEGHFHAPRLDQPPQGVLSVNLRDATNVNTFSARYDMLRPATAQATNLDIASRSDQQARVTASALSSLGKNTALEAQHQRRVLPSQTGLARTGELQAYAQALVDQSALAITADGELNTVAYGGILRAKRPVLVRGAGQQFSGTYYVERVHHVLTADSYKQSFTLRRNALGLSGRESFVENNALPA
ncbi:MAG: phage late control D family protein [Gemmatimonadales bacterium]